MEMERSADTDWLKWKMEDWTRQDKGGRWAGSWQQKQQKHVFGPRLVKSKHQT